MGRGTKLAIAATACGLLWPAGALAGTTAQVRYAEPNGDGANPCLLADPCGIFRAVEEAPFPAEVRLITGTYELGAEQVLDVPAGVFVVGLGKSSETILNSSAQIGVFVTSSTLADVTILGNNSRSLFLFSSAAARRVYVQNASTTDGSLACAGSTGATIVDSVCRGYGPTTGGVANLSEGFTSELSLRNVTAYSNGGPGILTEAANSSTGTTTVRNTIASGFPDVRATASSGSTATVNLDFSNYDTFSTSGDGIGSVTAPGSLDNQTAFPVFENAESGDFQEKPNSPTIDAGTAAGIIPSDADLDGNPRAIGNAPDIGAYESSYPAVTITKAPDPRTTKRRATFRFEGSDDVTAPEALTFECRLDDRAFRPCTSPKTYERVKLGKHRFFVRVTDGAGNTGVAVRYGWKVFEG